MSANPKRPESERAMRLATKLVHAGETRPHSSGSITVPIYQSSTFHQDPEVTDYHALKYIRLNNLPNHDVLGRKLAALEGAEAAVVTASGMAAETTALLSVLSSGDHLIAQDVLYGGTRSFFADDLPALGIEVDFVSGDDLSARGDLLRPNTKAVYVETLTNPLLQMLDLPAIASFARDNGLVSIIDNTVATPVYFRPLEHGFDLVVHSATKFLNGHTDIVAGVIAGSNRRVEAALHKLNHLGGSLDPHACFLLTRGLRTLELRVDRQASTARRLAGLLEEHAAVAKVYYPGLPSHPDHARAKRLLDGFGGLLSFSLAGGAGAVDTLLERLEYPIYAPSFGGPETLITQPARSSHASVAIAERERQGIDDGLLRVAVGLEDPDDLLDDFEQALDATV